MLNVTLSDEALRRVADVLADQITEHLAIPRPTDDRWLSTAKAAHHLGLSVNGLHKLTAARAVPFSQDAPGGKCWFLMSDLDAWRRAAV